MLSHKCGNCNYFENIEGVSFFLTDLILKLKNHCRYPDMAIQIIWLPCHDKRVYFDALVTVLSNFKYRGKCDIILKSNLN